MESFLRPRGRPRKEAAAREENRNENVPTSIAQRVGTAAGANQTIVAKPTGTQREQFAIARKELDEQTAVAKKRLETDVKELEKLLDQLGAPYTPGRVPGDGK
ncbi:MAG: hypothetical protein ACJ8C4_01790 [Gemmataceae bacterium]